MLPGSVSKVDCVADGPQQYNGSPEAGAAVSRRLDVELGRWSVNMVQGLLEGHLPGICSSPTPKLNVLTILGPVARPAILGCGRP